MKQRCLRLGEREAGSPPVSGTTDLERCGDQRKSSRLGAPIATRCRQSALIGTSTVPSATSIALAFELPRMDVTTSLTASSIRE